MVEREKEYVESFSGLLDVVEMSEVFDERNREQILRDASRRVSPSFVRDARRDNSTPLTSRDYDIAEVHERIMQGRKSSSYFSNRMIDLRTARKY